MASSMRSRRLECFYCGHKSPTKYDGFIRKWECSDCEATNYLDEHGEITDPPAGIVDRPSTTLQYALPLAQPESTPSSRDDNTLFCNDCLKNQHLVRSSLAQYIPEEKDTLAVDRDYQNFKDSLEKRYPQICEDCFQGVVDRLKQSSYTAKTDHLRRLLDKTRKNGAVRKAGQTWLDVFQSLGQILWSLSIYGQLAWNVLGIFRYQILRFWDLWALETSPLVLPLSTESEFTDVFMTFLLSYARSVLRFLQNWEIPISSPIDYEFKASTMAQWSLVLAFASIWWSPRFKEGFRGYHRHINGFHDWYKLQAFLLIVRVLFWLMMGLETFSNMDTPAAVGAHAFMLCFTILVTKLARKSIKVDFSPLFAPTSPERLLQYVRQKDKSKYNGQDMSQALTNILEESSTVSSSFSSSQQTDPFYEHDHPRSSRRTISSSTYELAPRRIPEGRGSIRRATSRDPRDVLGIPHTVPSLSKMTPDESFHYISTGEVPAHMHTEAADNATLDTMEWKPQGSQFRAFQPAQAPRQSQVFSQTPVALDSSPFWYKGLPPAPISQAHKIRNPPHQARLQPASQEAKENFFNRLTGRQYDSSPSNKDIVINDADDHSARPPRQEVEFAQQKLFIPAAANDVVAGLSDMFDQAFSLKPSGDEAVEGQDGSRRSSKFFSMERRRHILTTLVLILAWLAWNYSFGRTKLPKTVPFSVMSVCFAVALRSFAHCAMSMRSKSHPSLLYLVGIIFAALQAWASVYGISEIRAGRSSCETCQSQGAILMGFLLVQEIFFIGLAE